MSTGHRTTARRLVAACTGGVLALCASLYAAPAQAQTTFISNTDVVGINVIPAFDTPAMYAQPFRTGDNSGGYTLHSVLLRLWFFESTTTLMAEVRTNAADDTPSSTAVATLTAEDPLPDGSTTSVNVEFTAPSGTMLDPDTTYHLVFSQTGESTVNWVTAPLGSLEAGTASGWSFPLGWRETNIGGGSWSPTSSARGAARIRVRGTAIGAPMLDTAVVNGDVLVLTYDEALDEGSVPAASAFTLGGTVASVNTVAISGMRVTLSLSAAVTSTDVVAVSYTAPGTNPLQDVAGDDAANLSVHSVTNNTPAEPTQTELDTAREETLTTTLAGTGRLVAVSAVDALSTRFQQRVAGTGRRQSLTLAGKAVDLDGLRANGERQLAEALRDWRNVTPEDLMSNSAFELALSRDATGRGGGDGFILWGQGGWLDFDSKPQDTFSMDGHVLSGHVGLDYQLGGMLLGMALGHSSGEVDYVNTATGGSRGTVDSEILSLYPYMHYSPDGTGENAAWAMVGFGWGDAEVKEAGQEPIDTDIEMRMLGLGVRTGVYVGGGVDLALKADGFYTEMESDAQRNLPSVDSDAMRGRLALELGHSLEQAGGALNSSLEVAARVDAGDAEEGVGGEVGVGVGYTSLLGLDIEIRGRYLVAHTEEDFDEWGASVVVRYDTTRAGGQGLTFELAPGWGDASSRADSMWEDTHALLGPARPGARSLGPDHLNLQMGYGLRAQAGLLTPFSELSLAGQALRRVRLGVRLDLPGRRGGWW